MRNSPQRQSLDSIWYHLLQDFPHKCDSSAMFFSSSPLSPVPFQVSFSPVSWLSVDKVHRGASSASEDRFKYEDLK